MAARGSGTRSPEKIFPYRCFLVRCRLEENAGTTGQPAWRFTVQQAGAGGARHSFTCFDDVVAHMQAELASSAHSVSSQEPAKPPKEETP